MIKVINSAIILHNMIFEYRRDGYESEIGAIAEAAVVPGLFIDERGEEKPFNWCSRESLSNSGGRSMSYCDWAANVLRREMEVTDEVAHFSLKKDLIEHIC